MEYLTDKAYCALYPHILSLEGGYVNDPQDPGGATKYGIAYNFNQRELSALGISQYTMKTLTKEQAINIYYRKYWLASDCHKLHDLDLQFIHFDSAVNHGVGAATTMLDRLNPDPRHFAGNGKNVGLFADFFLDYFVMRLKRYATDKNRKRYLEGWVNRLIRVYDEAEKN